MYICLNLKNICLIVYKLIGLVIRDTILGLCLGGGEKLKHAYRSLNT